MSTECVGRGLVRPSMRGMLCGSISRAGVTVFIAVLLALIIVFYIEHTPLPPQSGMLPLDTLLISSPWSGSSTPVPPSSLQSSVHTPRRTADLSG